MGLPTDTWAYTNGLKRLPPEQKLTFSLLGLLLALVAQPVTQVCLSLLMAVWTIIYAKIPLQFYLKLLLGGSSFIMMSSLALLIDVQWASSETINATQTIFSGEIGGVYWSIARTNLELFTRLILRALASLSCFFFLMLTVPAIAIISILRQWRCPEILLELMLLMYRLIWVLQKTARELKLAQQARGGYRTFGLSLRSSSVLIQQLLHRSLVDYHRFALGTIARGFTHKFQILSTQTYQRSPRYEREATLSLLFLLGLDLYLRFA